MSDDSTETQAYKTVPDTGEVAFEIQGSRFLGRVDPVPDQAAANAHIADVRADHPEATHVVSAYRIRVGANPNNSYLREHNDDDGEPSGTAGSPALTVLKRRDLENVVATVVRYYGGTNLGAGGLARAYGRAVGEAVDGVGVKTARPQVELTITVAYDDSGTVRGILDSEDLEFSAEYGEEVVFQIRIATNRTQHITERLRNATGDRVDIVQTGTR